MLLTIFIPWFYKFPKVIIISVICGILVFIPSYTFSGVFVMLPIYSYLFLKLKGIFYGLLLMGLLLISIIVVNHTFPVILIIAFFHVNMAPAWSSMERLHQQLTMYGHLHLWTLVLFYLLSLGMF